MAELKTRATASSVARFIDGLEPPRRRDECTQLLPIMQRVTGHAPVLWSSGIIGFGRYHYRYASGRSGDWFISGFAPRKSNLTIYVMNGFADYAPLLDKLGKHRHAKSCLYVTRLQNIDLAVLEQLLERSVAWMRETYRCE